MDEGSRSAPLTGWVAYNALGVPALLAAFHLGRFFDEKIQRGFEGRRRLFERLEARRDALRGGVWLHASSAGEYEQARPLLRGLRRRTPDLPVLVTVFSPSGFERAIAFPEGATVEYLPLDTLPAIARALSIVQPRAIVFVKYDCWPNLVWTAAQRAIPSLLLGASLHRRSARLRPPGRWFFRGVYDRLHAIGTIGESDAALFRDLLGVDPARIRVCGDSRVDQILARLEQSEGCPLVRALQQHSFTRVVLGSLWPPDEALGLDPLLDAMADRPDHGLVIAPHEPTPAYLEHLESRLRARGWAPSRLSELVELRSGKIRSTAAARDRQRWRAILVDQVGVLAELYRSGVIAYVGGGLSTGVHSVVEPAASGLPVLFGPRHSNSHEATDLILADAAVAVTDVASARRAWQRWLDDPRGRREAGERAAACIRAQAGATERNLDLLASVLADPAAQTTR